MAEPKRYENRKRQHLVGVRLNTAEHAALTDAAARTGRTPARLLRETFLMADNHMLLPDLLGLYPKGDGDGH